MIGAGRWTLSGLLLIVLTSDFLKPVSAAADSCNVDECKKCTNGGMQCTACTSQVGSLTYRLDNGTCNSCPVHCIECPDNSACSSTCRSCEAGYYLNTVSNQCLDCIGGCKYCTSATVCQECIAEYYLSGTQCELCPGNRGSRRTCNRCSSGTECNECKDRYYKTGYTDGCLECPGNTDRHTPCESCTSSAMCDDCESTYYKTGDERGCRVCPPGCGTCENTGKEHSNGEDFFLCTSCSRKYFYKDNNHLHPVCKKKGCPDNCKSCNENSQCDLCEDGFYVHPDGRCRSCSIHNSQCTQCTRFRCSRCESGYYLDGENCEPCTYLTENQCNVCSRQEYAYVWDDQAVTPHCKGCPEGCASCHQNGNCTECMMGYILEGAVCTELNCNSPLNTRDKCHACHKYWNSGAGSCQNCPSSVTSITDKTQCIDCKGAWEGTCKRINCAGSPDNQADCDLCQEKRWEGGTCIDCSETNIDNVADCEKCKDRSMKECKYVECDGSIQDDGLRCQRCIGRRWDSGSGQCHAVNCQHLTLLTTREMCEACPGTFFEAGAAQDKCKRCRANCMKCSSATACDVCMDGYYLNAGDCSVVDCQTNPAALSSTQCPSCPGFKHNGTICMRVSTSDCSAPSDVGLCRSCRVYGLIWNGTTCNTVCTEGQVVNSMETCTMCHFQKWDDSSCKVTTYGEIPTNPIIAAVSFHMNVDDSAANCLNAHHYFSNGIGKCRRGQCENLGSMDQEECESCGQFWSSTECLACAQPNCAVCIGNQSICDICDFSYKSSGEGCVAAICSSSDEEDCKACPGKVWNPSGSGSCETVGDLSNANAHCPSAEELTCRRTCSGYGFYYNSGPGRCMSCPEDSNLHNDKRCGSCKTLKYTPTMKCLAAGQMDTQNGLPDVTCSGVFNTENKCSMCMGRMWTTQCEAVDCNNQTGLDDESKCTACSGFFWDSSACKRCPINCDECHNATTCLRCLESFTFDEFGVCVKPTFGCNVLDPVPSSPHNCQTCPGRWWDGSACVEITEVSCTVDASLDLCRACRKFGYLRNSSDHCIKECTEGAPLDDEDKCLQCQHVKWDAGDGSCKATLMQPMGGGFGTALTCSSMTGAASCDCAERYWQETCEVFDSSRPAERMTRKACGYTLGKKWDTDTDKCIDLDCTQTQNNQLDCNKCNNSYWDTTWNICRGFIEAECGMGGSAKYQTEDRCDACSRMENPGSTAHMWLEQTGSCKACHNSLSRRTSCEYCPGQYWNNSPDTCMDCPDDCTACTGPQSCTQCDYGIILSDGQCQGNCLIDSKEICESCGHVAGNMSYWDSSTSPNECHMCGGEMNEQSCQKCSQEMMNWDGSSCIGCISNCARCTNSTDCEACDDGYCYDIDQKICVATSEKCDKCYTEDTKVKCIDCHKSHYLRQCDYCGDRCERCGDEGCLECRNGYYPNSTGIENYVTCLPCGTGCANCGSNGCEACESNYHTTNEGPGIHVTCRYCGTGCVACNSENCTECDTRYYLKDGSCTRCGSHCQACDAQQCITCDDTYFKESDTSSSCTKCGDNCKACKSLQKCDTCEENYFKETPSSGSCDACRSLKDNCEECSLQGQKVQCDKCMPGHHLVDDTCQSCQNVTSQCSECSRKQECEVCNENYVAVNGKCVPTCFFCPITVEKLICAPNKNKMEACPGIVHGTHRCVTRTIFDKDEEVKVIQRGCEKVVDVVRCDNDTQTAGDKEIDCLSHFCTHCCTEPGCNMRDHIYTGASVTINQPSTIILSSIIAILLLVIGKN